MNQYWRTNAGGADQDLESLQTDVMRFVAILGLCLAAIFSLVQGLSDNTATAQIEISQHNLPDQQTEQLAEQLAAQLQQQLEETDRQKRELAMQSEALSALHDDMSSERQRLRELRKALAEQQSQAKPEPTIVPEPTTVPEPEPTSVPEPKVQAKPKPKPKPEPALVPTPKPKPEPQQGYLLGFASADALRALLRRSQVGLYVGTSGRYWKLDLSAGAFVDHASPGAFYGMDYSTVPSDIAALFQRTVSGNQQKLDWGVTLPAPTVNAIRQRMTERPGGELQIAADGRVDWARD